jgi:hypothetical protein
LTHDALMSVTQIAAMIRSLLIGLLAIGSAYLASGLAGPGDAAPAQVAAGPAGFPHPTRVALLVLENRSYSEVIDSGDAPFLNRLAHRYALATRYYALTHPSLPNYVALTTGGTGGITTDCSNCDTSVRPS